MFRRAVIVLPLFAVWLAVPGDASAQVKHPRMHPALTELKASRIELKEAAHDFGGHRKAALGAVDAAIAQIEIALTAARDPYMGGTASKAGGKKTKYPHIHRAMNALREARVELRDAKHNFGGHREKALKEVNYALDQLQKALKFAKS